jgi:ABC-type lipoprotein release transport system permease subunit
VALLASPLGPVGLARPLEPHPGIRLDATIVLGGPALLFGVVLAGAVPAVWWSLRRRPMATPRRRGAAVVRTPLPLAIVVGIRGALGRDRDGVPAAVAVAGLTVGIGALAATFTFSRSLDHLVHTPRLYGWDSDATVFDNYGQVDDVDIAAALSAEPAVATFAPRLGGSGTIAGRAVGLQAVDSADFAPVLTAGRAPAGPDEVVLGGRTRRQAHTRIGGTVEIRAGDRTGSFRVVGETVLAGSLGDGARLTPAGLRSLQPDGEVDTFLLRWRPGTDVEAAATRFGQAFQHLPVGPELDRPTRPVDVANLERVGSLPFLLAGVLAVGALASLVHALAVARRRLRRELAVLKAVGFTGGQSAVAVAARAVTLTGLGLAVGLPLGTAAGRWLWRLFADELGVVPDPVTSVPFLVAAVPVAVLLTLAVAALPARRAARLRPALVLRTE